MSFRRWSFLLSLAAISALPLLLSLPVPLLQGRAPAAQSLAQSDGVVPGELLVQFRPGTPATAIENAVQGVGAEVVERFRSRPHLLYLRVPGQAADAILNIQRNPNVEFAQPNFIYELTSTPNDTLFNLQWGLNQANDIDIDAPEAWNYETGDSDVVIAVLDTGVDTSHPDLTANLWDNPGETANNDIDDDDNDYVDDIHGWSFSESLAGDDEIDDTTVHGHGTHVAGIVAARGNNSTGVSGVMWNASIMVVKIFSGPCGLNFASTAQVVAAIDYAVDNGAQIVNGSFAHSPASSVVDNAVRDAIEDAADTTLFVFAAGNRGWDVDISGQARYPCAWNSPNLICVAAVDSDGDLWVDPTKVAGTVDSGSAFGVISVDLAAPGAAVESTYRSDCTDVVAGCCDIRIEGCSTTTGPTECLTLANYGVLTGTSMAAPHVAGVAGLVMSLHPEDPMDPNMSGANYIRRIKESILLTAQPTSGAELDGTTLMGGMLNARRALNAFGDTFDDADENADFFVDDPTKSRWAVAQNGGSEACDVEVVNLPDTEDRSVELTFSGTSSWTLVSYQAADYEPGNNSQSIILHVATDDGSDFTNKEGRIGVGIVGQTGLSTESCGMQTYNEASFGGSSLGGVDLGAEELFMFFDPPLDDRTFDSIDLEGVTKLTISVFFTSDHANLRVFDGSTGESLAEEENIVFPGNWDFTGTLTAAFGYFGTQSNTDGTLLARSIVSIR